MEEGSQSRFSRDSMCVEGLHEGPCDTLQWMARVMNQVQGNTPPKWLGRSSWALFGDVIGGIRQNAHKGLEIIRMVGAMVRPSVVRRRVERLRDLGHCEQVPSMAQLLVASRDQLSFSLGADTEVLSGPGIPGPPNFRCCGLSDDHDGSGGLIFVARHDYSACTANVPPPCHLRFGSSVCA